MGLGGLTVPDSSDSNRDRPQQEARRDCDACGGSGIEWVLGYENSVMEFPCSLCFPVPPREDDR